MLDHLQHALMTTVDAIVAAIPQRTPQLLALRQCKIIAHRGAHDNTTVMENTLRSFELARAHGVWGVECDVRWTADLVPVISHDANTSRVFSKSVDIASVSFEQLRDLVPHIPSLMEVVEQFGGNLHLMLEIKAETQLHATRQKDILRKQLATLAAGRDYHFLALDPVLFERVDFVAPQHCFPVSELNAGKLSKATLESSYGGLTGHYLLLGAHTKARHEAAGQRIGTGFIGSKNALFRELNRGVEWIFSNDALKIQTIRDDLLSTRG